MSTKNATPWSVRFAGVMVALAALARSYVVVATNPEAAVIYIAVGVLALVVATGGR